jgi:hypothetical protein
MNDSTTTPAPPGSRYGDQRPYALVESLTDLRGPTAGLVRLDRRLDWSPNDGYDLGNPRRLATMYETVLREASHADDLIRWLDAATLMRIWTALVLPPRLRRAWESRFPDLAAAQRSAA